MRRPDPSPGRGHVGTIHTHPSFPGVCPIAAWTKPRTGCICFHLASPASFQSKEIPWDLTVVNPLGSPSKMKESSEEAAAPHRPSEEPLHTAVTSSGRGEAQDRAIVSRTSLHMSPSGARAQARPWWLSKWWSPGDGLLKQLVLVPVSIGLTTFLSPPASLVGSLPRPPTCG